MQHYLNRIVKKLVERKKEIIISFAIGIVTYGSVIFNKYSVHDDTYLFALGRTFEIGRWMLGLLGKITRIITGTNHYSLPVFNGLLTIVLLIIAGLEILNLFKIDNKWISAAFLCAMITIPAFIGLMGYMFTAPYYALANLMTVVGLRVVIINNKNRNIFNYSISTLLLTCAMGIYQNMIAIFVALFIIYLITETIKNNDYMLIKNGVKFTSITILSFIIYVIANKVFMAVFRIKADDYRGISSYGITSLKGFIVRLKYAYTEFLLPSTNRNTNMYPGMAIVIYEIIIVLLLITSAYLLIKLFKKNKKNTILIAILLLSMPVIINMVYLMCDIEDIHTIMMIPSYIVFILFISMISLIDVDRVKRIASRVAVVLIFIIVVLNCRFGNATYLKADIVQSQLKSYYTELKTRIESTKGYSNDKKIVYVGEFKKDESAIVKIEELDRINIIPWTRNRYGINEYAWRNFMKIWCGFDPKLEDSKKWENNEIVKKMPCYPNDGSIKCINNRIIVKFK